MAPNHYYGDRSSGKIATLDARWPAILDDVLWALPFDVAVICGYRDEEAQTEAFLAGRSRVRWPHSKHNQLPSLAVDLAPIMADGRIPWNEDYEAQPWFELRAAVMAAGKARGVEVVAGADWSTFTDLPHFQLG